MATTIPTGADTATAAPSQQQISTGKSASTPAPEPSPAPEPEPSPEPEPEDSLSVSAEDLAKIRQHPELSKLYRGLNKAAETQRQRLAEERAKIAQDLDIAATVRADPAQAARVIANAVGLKIVEEAQRTEPIVDEIIADLSKIVGPQFAAQFTPILERAIDRRVEKIVEERVAPIAEQTQDTALQTIEARSEAEVTAFKAKHPGVITDAVEAKMVELTQKYPAGEEVTADEYLEGILTMALGRKSEQAATREVVQRMQAAASSQEPRTGGVQHERIGASPDFKGKSFDEAIDAAWAAAKAQSKL